jgi:hypothetical protein
MRKRTLAAALIVAVAATAVAGLLLLRREASEPVPQPRTTIEQALAAFVRDRFGTRYVGTCPQGFPARRRHPPGHVLGEVLRHRQPCRVRRRVSVQ